MHTQQEEAECRHCGGKTKCKCEDCRDVTKTFDDGTPRRWVAGICAVCHGSGFTSRSINAR